MSLKEIIEFCLQETIYCISPIASFVMKSCSANSGQYTFHLYGNLASKLEKFALLMPCMYNSFAPFDYANCLLYSNSDDTLNTSKKIQKLNDEKVDCVIIAYEDSIGEMFESIISNCNSEFILIVENYNILNVRKQVSLALETKNVIWSQQFITRWPNSPQGKNPEQETFGNGLFIAIIKI